MQQEVCSVIGKDRTLPRDERTAVVQYESVEFAETVWPHGLGKPLRLLISLANRSKQ